jgi:hypothetical protein
MGAKVGETQYVRGMVLRDVRARVSVPLHGEARDSAWTAVLAPSDKS